MLFRHQIIAQNICNFSAYSTVMAVLTRNYVFTYVRNLLRNKNPSIKFVRNSLKINQLRLSSTNTNSVSAIGYLQNLGDGSVYIELNDSSGIATIFLNNPKKKNALSGRMMVDLYNAVNFLENWSEGKAVILQGVGDCFCSGGDLDVFKEIAENGRTEEMSLFMSHAMEKLSNLPLVTVSFVAGRGAFGGGAELAMATDFCFIHPDSKIGFVHASMGVTQAWNGGLRLRERIGKQKALEVLLKSKSMNADLVVKAGIVDGIFKDVKEIESFLADMLRHEAIVITSTKKSLLTDEPAQRCKIFGDLLGAESNKKAVAAKLKHS